MKNSKKWLLVALTATGLALSGCSGEDENEKAKPSEGNTQIDDQENEKDTENTEQTGTDFIVKAAPQTIDHIHGIGYPGNDEGLYVASHHGIKIHKAGAWLETSGENHDYMGFQATKDGYYASGHPEKGSPLKNPLGLIKSTDKGQSLQKIAFYGESDFHFLSASFQDKVLYLINEEPNSKLERGVYVSKDAAKTWKPVELNGLESNSLGMIASHPEKGGTFAMATREGAFFTVDYGKTMKKTGNYEMVTAAAFSKESLYITPVVHEKIKLLKLNAENFEQAEELPIPFLKYDNPITYLAADPKQEGRIAFITILNDLYESEDGGQTWKQLLVNGKIQ